MVHLKVITELMAALEAEQVKMILVLLDKVVVVFLDKVLMVAIVLPLQALVEAVEVLHKLDKMELQVLVETVVTELLLQ